MWKGNFTVKILRLAVLAKDVTDTLDIQRNQMLLHLLSTSNWLFYLFPTDHERQQNKERYILRENCSPSHDEYKYFCVIRLITHVNISQVCLELLNNVPIP